MSAVVDSAEAIVAALNGAGDALSRTLQARRDYAPVHDLAALSGLTVTVVPDVLAVEARTLGTRRGPALALDWDFHVWIQRRTSDLAEKDALMGLAEEIVLLFDPWRARPDNRVMAIECRPAIAAGKSDRAGVFETVVTLTVRTNRTP